MVDFIGTVVEELRPGQAGRIGSRQVVEWVRPGRKRRSPERMRGRAADVRFSKVSGGWIETLEEFVDFIALHDI
jgi:hypothetical protein